MACTVLWIRLIGKAMLLILDGASEMGAHVWSEIGNLIGLRYLFGTTERSQI